VKNIQIQFAAIAASLALLAGCAAGGGTKNGKGEDASVLRKRSVERWDALIEHKADKAWDYLTPGYRETKPREQYAKEMNERGIHWTKVRYSSQECEPETCKVRLAVEYDLNLGGMAGTVHSMAPLIETWIKIDGHWYFLPDQLQPTKPGSENS